MPGKVNPVIAESVTMVCAQVIGNDVTVAIGGQAGNFELLVMLPVMAYNLLQSIELLATASTNFATRCIDGIEANEARCRSLIEESLAMCTALAPEIGYEAAAKIAKDAYKSGKSVRTVAQEQRILPDKRLAELLEIEPISVSRLLDRMEEGGWIERRADASDRRVRTIFPTAKALDAYQVVKGMAGEVYEEALAGVSPEERRDLIRALEAITINLSDGDTAAATATTTDNRKYG